MADNVDLLWNRILMASSGPPRTSTQTLLARRARCSYSLSQILKINTPACSLSIFSVICWEGMRFRAFADASRIKCQNC